MQVSEKSQNSETILLLLFFFFLFFFNINWKCRKYCIYCYYYDFWLFLFLEPIADEGRSHHRCLLMSSGSRLVSADTWATWESEFPPLLLLHSSLSLYFAIFTWLPNNRRWIFSSVPSNRPHKRVIWRVFVSDMREKHVWSQRKIKTCADLARHLFLLVSSVFVSSQGSSRSGRGAVTFSYSEDDSIGINSACNFMPVFLAWMCDNWST